MVFLIGIRSVLYHPRKPRGGPSGGRKFRADTKVKGASPLSASLRSAFDILKSAPFETDCPWVSEDGFVFIRWDVGNLAASSTKLITMGRCLDITPLLVAHSPLMETTGSHLGHLQGERQRWLLQWLVDSGIHGWR